MQEWIIDTMNSFGYAGVMILIAIENIFPPIPSEIILTFGGFMTTYTDMDPWILSLFATAGSLIGAAVLYSAGRILGAERVYGLLSGWGRRLGLRKENLDKAARWFDDKGKKTVFLCRFIPIVRSLISIPAGMAKMNAGAFVLYTTIGTMLWNVVLIWLGRLAGNEWESIVAYVDAYSVFALTAFATVFITACAVLMRRAAKRRAQAAREENSAPPDGGDAATDGEAAGE